MISTKDVSYGDPLTNGKCVICQCLDCICKEDMVFEIYTSLDKEKRLKLMERIIKWLNQENVD